MQNALCPQNVDTSLKVFYVTHILHICFFFQKHPEEEITVESLKRMLAESPTAKRQAAEERRLRIIDEFRTAAFEDLVAKAEQQVSSSRHGFSHLLCSVWKVYHYH